MNDYSKLERAKRKTFTTLSELNLGGFLYKLAECSQDVFWIRSIDGKEQLYISPAFEKVWGITRKSLYIDPESWFSTIHPEDKERVQNNFELFMQDPYNENNNSIEYRLLCSNQEIKWIKESWFPLLGAEQRLLGFAGVAKEITHEKQKLVELEKATLFFKFFAEKIQQVVFWARDPFCNKQVYVSPSYEKIWGRSCESLYENPAGWIETLVEEDRDTHTADNRLLYLKEKGSEVKYEDRYRIRTPKGKIKWIKDTSFPIFDEQNRFKGFAGIAEDVTKDVLYELELREAMQRAEAGNQAKSDFLGIVSHELRTPLNAILGMTQIMRARESSPEFKEYVEIINDAGKNLLSLVNDILDFVKLEAGQLSFVRHSFALNELMSQIVHSMRYQAVEKNLNLFLNYPKEIPNAVVSDPNRIRQILVNLLSNAIKFTEQGHITVNVSCLKKSKRKAWFEIIVADTGIGISKDKLNFIFEKFNQINPVYYKKYQGIGLGLSITKELIEKMGGRIEADSDFGKGSKFKIILPLQLWHQTALTQAKENEEALHLPKTQYHLNILLVEDNVINQRVAKVMLEDFGCKVDIIDNGFNVLKNINSLRNYHLIFMDVGLPDISGFDIVSKLRLDPQLKDLPIIAMTAHILKRDRQHAFDCGMNKIVTKPITYEDIGKVLEQYAKL